jgi:choline dehydrogenase-like flavoprotein
LDWDLFGEPEPGLGGKRLYMPRGRVLGGSGSINAMIYIRGNPADYDEWAAMGFEGWAYDDVLPYFKRTEDNERGEDMYHGVGGPLSVAESRSMHPLVDTMIEAAKQAGHEHNPDLNGARQEGVGRGDARDRPGKLVRERLGCRQAHPQTGECSGTRPDDDARESIGGLRAFVEDAGDRRQEAGCVAVVRRPGDLAEEAAVQPAHRHDATRRRSIDREEDTDAHTDGGRARGFGRPGRRDTRQTRHKAASR